MNNATPHPTPATLDAADRRIDLFLDGYRQGGGDAAERIKALTHAKLLRERQARARLLRRRVAVWLSAAAVVAIAVGACLWALRPAGSLDLSSATEAALAEAGYTTVTVPAGQRRVIALSDGSVITANARTTVKYPASFAGDERRIYASGEVYCQVAKDAAHPFVVESKGFDVRVLGTTFNLRNATDSTAQVVLVEGSVEIATATRQSVRMSPNDLVDLSNGNITGMRSVDAADYTAWIQGLLYFHGEPLGTVVGYINDHYDLAVSCDSTLAGVKVYGKLDLKSDPAEVLNSIQSIVPMKVERQGRHIRLRHI